MSETLDLTTPSNVDAVINEVSEEAPEEAAPAEEAAPVEEAPEEAAPAEEAAPEEAAPVEEAPEEAAPVEEAPVEEAPVEEAPEEAAPVEEAPEEAAPVEEAPVEETPVEETPEEAAPVEEAPVEETPVEETPEEAAPVEETPVEEAPVEETPVEETPVEETPEEAAPVVGVEQVASDIREILTANTGDISESPSENNFIETDNICSLKTLINVLGKWSGGEIRQKFIKQLLEEDTEKDNNLNDIEKTIEILQKWINQGNSFKENNYFKKIDEYELLGEPKNLSFKKQCNVLKKLTEFVINVSQRRIPDNEIQNIVNSL